MKKVRASLYGLAFVALVTGVLLIPTPLQVQGTLTLTLEKPTMVYAEVPGQLTDLLVRDGEFVKEGDVLATLSNKEKLRERISLEEQQKANHIKALWFGQASDLSSRAQEQQHRKMEQDLEPAIAKVSEQIGKLTIIAPRSGQAVGVPHPETKGQWLQPGKPFFEIGDPHRLEAHIILDQSDVDLINSRPDRKATAWVKIYGTSETTWRSYVAEVATRNREDIPAELSHLAGGEIATKQNEKTGQVEALTAMYEVTIPIDNGELLLQPGLRGFAKIDCGSRSFGWWLWRAIAKTFHFTL